MLASLPPHELEAGWDEGRARNWTTVFGTLRDAIVNGKPLASQYKNVVFSRGLDMDSICSGEISDLAVALGPDLRAMIADEEQRGLDDGKDLPRGRGA